MQVTQPTCVIQYGTDDAQNPWCVVEETTHRDYYNNTSVRRVCTVNSILTRRSLDPTTFTSAPASSANIQISSDPTIVTPTAPLSANVQETHEDQLNPTDDGIDVSLTKSQKKVAKSRSRRKKFLRALLCCSSGAADADDDIFDTKPMDPLPSIYKSSAMSNANDLDAASKNVQSTSGRTEYVPIKPEWSVTPEHMEYYRQTASSGEYGATITQEVRRQSAISTAQDSMIIEVLREQRHYECTLARVPENLERHRRGIGRSSVTIRELSPNNSQVSQTAIAENAPETTSENTENASPRTNLTTKKPNEVQCQHMRRSEKRRVSFGSTPTVTETTPRPRQHISAYAPSYNTPEDVTELQSKNMENAPSLTKLTSTEQSETRNKHRRRSGKRVSFGSTPTLSEATPGPLQCISEGASTSAIVSSFCSENPLNEYEDKEDNSAKHGHDNTENSANNVNSKKDVPVKSALRVRDATTLNTHNEVTSNSNNGIHKTSARTDKRGENLVIKRRSDGSRYVTKKTYNTGDQKLVDSTQGPTRSELPGEIGERYTEYILDTPRLSRKMSSDKITANARANIQTEDIVINTSNHTTDHSDCPVKFSRSVRHSMSKRRGSGSTSSCANIDSEVITPGGSHSSSMKFIAMESPAYHEKPNTIEQANVATKTNLKNKSEVPLKSILKAHGSSALNVNHDVTKSLNSVNPQEPEVKKWVVKRRSDGSRYVTKISNNNNNISGRRSSEYANIDSDMHHRGNQSQSDVTVELHKDKSEPVRRCKMRISENGRNNVGKPSRDEEHHLPSASKTMKQQKEFSASDPSIDREERHRLVFHCGVDLSGTTLLAVL